MAAFNVLIFLFVFVCFFFVIVNCFELNIYCAGWFLCHLDSSQDCLGEGILIKTKIPPYSWPVSSPVVRLMGD